jgi:hypothetical protein
LKIKIYLGSFDNALAFFLFFFLLQEFEENASVQIRGSRNPKNNEKKFLKVTCTKIILKTK